jgi:hypothetical protein
LRALGSDSRRSRPPASSSCRQAEQQRQQHTAQQAAVHGGVSNIRQQNAKRRGLQHTPSIFSPHAQSLQCMHPSACCSAMFCNAAAHVNHLNTLLSPCKT